jgi:hypothetical protein
MNLVELVMKQFGGDTLGRLSGLLGTSGDQTRSALSAAVPTVLAGLSQLAGTSEGARKIAAAVDSADEDVANNAAQALAGNGRSMIESGSSMLGSLFGANALSGIGSVLSRFSGLGMGAITSLLGAITPMILGVLKGKKQELGLDAGGLSKLLAGQQQNIMGAMPTGLGSMLGSIPGLGALSGLTGKASQTAGQAVNAYDSGRAAVRQGVATATAGPASAARWALPLLGILALGLILWWALRDRSAPTPTVVANPPPQPSIEQQAGDALTAAARLPGLDQLPANLRDQVSGFFKSSTEAFSGITNAASAEAALPKLRDLNMNLDGLQSAVEALPAESRSAVRSVFETSFDKLKPTIDKVMSMPGVSDKIKPVVDELLKKANTLMGK